MALGHFPVSHMCISPLLTANSQALVSTCVAGWVHGLPRGLGLGEEPEGSMQFLAQLPRSWQQRHPPRCRGRHAKIRAR